MKVIIGLAGVKTSGKSTVANMLKELLHESNTLESALANKLKEVSAQVFEVARDHFDDQRFKEVPFEKPIVLHVEHVRGILNLFNVSVTPELMQGYFNNHIIGMELKSPRQIAQIVGTEILRAAGDEDIHCKSVSLSDEVTIISDMRFPNEFEYFKNLLDVKFVPLYIQRDEAEKHVTANSHPSETSVFKFTNKCFKIDNNQTLENTKSQLRGVLKQEGLLNRA